ELMDPPRPRAGQEAPPKVWKLTNLETKETIQFNNEADAKAALAKVADPIEAAVNWSDLKLSGPQKVRDLWRQKDMGAFGDQYTVIIPFHGAVMLKIGASK